VEGQIASTQAAIREANAPKPVETTLDVNPIHFSLEQDLRKAHADSLGQAARASTLTLQANAERARMDQYEKISLDEDALERNVQDLKQNHETYVQKRDEAQIDDRLDQSKIVDISIAQEPTFSRLPVQPHRLLMLGMGSFASLFLALACVFVKDAMRQIAYTPAELEAMCGCPVLATIPESNLRAPKGHVKILPTHAPLALYEPVNQA
jgi:capsular polysaccharide biosynthesis protein